MGRKDCDHFSVGLSVQWRGNNADFVILLSHFLDALAVSPRMDFHIQQDFIFRTHPFLPARPIGTGAILTIDRHKEIAIAPKRCQKTRGAE
jgi:hypothetical protein